MMMGTDFSIAAGVLFDIGNYCLSIDFTSTLGCLSLGAGLGMNF